MAWTGLTLTVDGRNALNYAQINNRLNFKSIVVGDGTVPANFNTMKGLVHQLYELTDLKIDMTETGCTLTADFPKVDYDYYFREVGVIVTTDNGDKLYVYDNCGKDAQYIVSSIGVEATEKRLRLSLVISDVTEITVSNPSILYVAYDDYEKTVETLNKSKVDKVVGKELSTNDYTDAEKNKLAGIETGANNYTHPATHPATMIAQDAQHRFVTDADKNTWNNTLSNAKNYADSMYQQSTGYVDQKVANLINGAPSTLDTLGEVAKAMEENESVVKALDVAIGSKANEVEFRYHEQNNTIHVTATEKEGWNRKLEAIDKMLGTTDISTIGDGTVTGAIDAVNISLLKNVKSYQGLDFNAADFCIYTGKSAPGSSGCSNYPIDETGLLISYIDTVSYQTYITYTGGIYTRAKFYSRTWTAWEKLAYNSNLDVFDMAIAGLTNDKGKLYRLMTRASGNTISCDWEVIDSQRYLTVYIDNVLVDRILPYKFESPNIKITNVQFPASASVSLVANQASYLTMTLDNIAGYTPVMFDISLTGGAGIVPYGKNLNISTRIVRIDAINLSNTTVTMQPTIRVLWVRDDLL